jgi:quinol monooxygenase YgiN
MTGQDASVVTVARWHTTDDARSEILSRISALKQQSLAEPGCLGYEALQAVDDPNSFILVESYRDTAALDAHRGSAHYRELVIGHILPLLSDRDVAIMHHVHEV